MSPLLLTLRMLIVVVLIALLFVSLRSKLKYNSVQSVSQWYSLRKDFELEYGRDIVQEDAAELYEEQSMVSSDSHNNKKLPPKRISSEKLRVMTIKTITG